VNQQFAARHRAPVIRDYEIRLPELPPQYDGQVLVALSDLHVGTFLDEKWLAARVAQVNALKPDVVVLLGDLFEGDSPGERKKSMMHLFHEISAPLGVWGVTGNHESHGGLDSTILFLEAAGVHMLRNQWSEIELGLVLAGIDDRQDHNRTSDTTSQIGRALSGRPLSTATIFLSHRPLRAEQVAAAGVGLMLSGHTHGGQIWPFSYISGLVNPLMAGKYIINGMPVIVSRGTGSWGPRMRLWYPGEILRIVLRSK
jgi:predicted MPP superfamily phosphohydrolase